MSTPRFDARRGELEALRWPVLEIEEENALAPHMTRALVDAARWAEHLAIRAGWFHADYGALVCPEAPAPADAVDATVAAARSHGMRGLFTPRYVELLLRWAWAADHADLGRLPPPYDPMMDIFRAGGIITGEHGFIGVGTMQRWIGAPERHLQHA